MKPSTFRRIRKDAGVVDAKINEAVWCWNVQEGKREPAGFFIDKARMVANDIPVVLKELDIACSELEKDSKTRPYYKEKYSEYYDFLHMVKHIPDM